MRYTIQHAEWEASRKGRLGRAWTRFETVGVLSVLLLTPLVGGLIAYAAWEDLQATKRELRLLEQWIVREAMESEPEPRCFVHGVSWSRPCSDCEFAQSAHLTWQRRWPNGHVGESVVFRPERVDLERAGAFAATDLRNLRPLTPLVLQAFAKVVVVLLAVLAFGVVLWIGMPAPEKEQPTPFNLPPTTTDARSTTPLPPRFPSGKACVANTGGEGVYLRRSPSLGDREGQAYAEGTIVRLVDRTGCSSQEDSFCHVRCPDHRVGYIPLRYLSEDCGAKPNPSRTPRPAAPRECLWMGECPRGMGCIDGKCTQLR